MTFKNKKISPFADPLKRLVDEKTWREEMTNFSMDQIEDEDARKKILEIVTVVLYSKMFVRKGRMSLSTRRKAILRFMSSFKTKELASFVNMMFLSLDPVCDKFMFEEGEFVTNQETIDAVVACGGKTIKGFLNLAHDVVSHLRLAVATYWEKFVPICCLEYAF